jgi:hypothetical protein
MDRTQEARASQESARTVYSTASWGGVYNTHGMQPFFNPMAVHTSHKLRKHIATMAEMIRSEVKALTYPTHIYGTQYGTVCSHFILSSRKQTSS